MNIIKTFTTEEIISIVNFIDRTMTAEQLKSIPTKLRWNLKKNLDKLIPVTNGFDRFREELIKELQVTYFDDEHSEEIIETETDNDGNPVLENDGSEKTKKVRKVKTEYMEEYTNAINGLNDKLLEILAEPNDIEISTVDFDKFVDEMPDDSPLDFDCLNILSFMDETTNLKSSE